MHKKTLAALLLIMAIAAFFRLYSITGAPPGLYPDEAMNGNNALEALENNPPAGGWKIFYPENNGREGLFINIISGSIAIFGNKPWAVRLPSAIFGILTILGFYLFTRELLETRNQKPEVKLVALIAAFLMATSFWHVNFSRIAFRAIMAPFFLVWSLYFLHKVFRGSTSKQGASLYAALAGLFFGLGFHTYIAFRIMPLLLLIPLVYGIWLSKKNAIQACLPCIIAVFIIFFLIAIAPLIFYFAQNPVDFFGRTTQISIFSTENPLGAFLKNKLLTLGMFNIMGDRNWRHNIAGEPQLWWPIGILFIIGFVLTLKNLFSIKKNPSEGYVALLLLVWFALALTPAILSFEGIPHALRSIIVIPVVYIWSAQGLWFIVEKIKNWLAREKEKYPQSIIQLRRIQKELLVLLFAFLLAVGVYGFNQYFSRWTPNQNTRDAFNENYVRIGEFLNTTQPEIPKYVIVNTDGVLVRGIPMPAQTVMFITNTFTTQNQRHKNIHYILSEDIGGIMCDSRCIITMLEKNLNLTRMIRDKISGSKINLLTNFVVIQK